MPHYLSLFEANKLLPTTNRVLVIGCSGGGKSTLSDKIAKKYDLKLVSIDRDVRWLPGWQERKKDQQRTIISKIVKQERWVIDGSGASSFDLRLPRTDLVLWVRVPRHIALLGLARRVTRNFGSVRPFMADGCPERIPDKEFLSYIWYFEKKHTPIFIREIDSHGPDVPVCLLRSHSQVDELMR